MMRGRPSRYSDAIAEEMFERLSQGELLTSICADDHMPAVRTVSLWKEKADFAAGFARARALGMDAIADAALNIADEKSNDTIVTKDGNETANSEWISRSKLRVETRLKLLAVWDPARFGNKIDVTSQGERVGELDETAAAARLASILAAAQARKGGK